MFAVLLTGCASYSGSGLVPGEASEAQVMALMGKPSTVRAAPDGEKVLWYSRLPFGRASYAARIGSDDRLIGIEQRLTAENIARLRVNQTTGEEVLDLLGPPNQTYQYPRTQREAWEYQVRVAPGPRTLYVQFSPDQVVREIFQLSEDQKPVPFFGY